MKVRVCAAGPCRRINQTICDRAWPLSVGKTTIAALLWSIMPWLVCRLFPCVQHMSKVECQTGSDVQLPAASAAGGVA